MLIGLLAVLIGALLTSPFSNFNLQELAAMSGHHVPLHQGPDGAHVPQGLVKGQQLGGEVERSSARTKQSALLFTGQGRDCTAKQCIRLYGGAQEWVGILGERKKDIRGRQDWYS